MKTKFAVAVSAIVVAACGGGSDDAPAQSGADRPLPIPSVISPPPGLTPDPGTSPPPVGATETPAPPPTDVSVLPPILPPPPLTPVQPIIPPPPPAVGPTGAPPVSPPPVGPTDTPPVSPPPVGPTDTPPVSPPPVGPTDTPPVSPPPGFEQPLLPDPVVETPNEPGQGFGPQPNDPLFNSSLPLADQVGPSANEEPEYVLISREQRSVSTDRISRPSEFAIDDIPDTLTLVLGDDVIPMDNAVIPDRVQFEAGFQPPHITSIASYSAGTVVMGWVFAVDPALSLSVEYEVIGATESQMLSGSFDSLGIFENERVAVIEGLPPGILYLAVVARIQGGMSFNSGVWVPVDVAERGVVVRPGVETFVPQGVMANEVEILSKNTFSYPLSGGVPNVGDLGVSGEGQGEFSFLGPVESAFVTVDGRVIVAVEEDFSFETYFESMEFSYAMHTERAFASALLASIDEVDEADGITLVDGRTGEPFPRADSPAAFAKNAQAGSGNTASLFDEFALSVKLDVTKLRTKEAPSLVGDPSRLAKCFRDPSRDLIAIEAPPLQLDIVKFSRAKGIPHYVKFDSLGDASGGGFRALFSGRLGVGLGFRGEVAVALECDFKHKFPIGGIASAINRALPVTVDPDFKFKFAPAVKIANKFDLGFEAGVQVNTGFLLRTSPFSLESTSYRGVEPGLSLYYDYKADFLGQSLTPEGSANSFGFGASIEAGPGLSLRTFTNSYALDAFIDSEPDENDLLRLNAKLSFTAIEGGFSPIDPDRTAQLANNAYPDIPQLAATLRNKTSFGMSLDSNFSLFGVFSVSNTIDILKLVWSGHYTNNLFASAKFIPSPVAVPDGEEGLDWVQTDARLIPNTGGVIPGTKAKISPASQIIQEFVTVRRPEFAAPSFLSVPNSPYSRRVRVGVPFGTADGVHLAVYERNPTSIIAALTPSALQFAGMNRVALPLFEGFDLSKYLYPKHPSDREAVWDGMPLMRARTNPAPAPIISNIVATVGGETRSGGEIILTNAASRPGFTGFNLRFDMFSNNFFEFDALNEEGSTGPFQRSGFNYGGLRQSAPIAGDSSDVGSGDVQVFITKQKLGVLQRNYLGAERAMARKSYVITGTVAEAENQGDPATIKNVAISFTITAPVSFFCQDGSPQLLRVTLPPAAPFLQSTTEDIPYCE